MIVLTWGDRRENQEICRMIGPTRRRPEPEKSFNRSSHGRAEICRFHLSGLEIPRIQVWTGLYWSPGGDWTFHLSHPALLGREDEEDVSSLSSRH